MDWPRDRGWSWVVLVATMATCFLEMGVYKSFGIYINAYLEEFNTSVTVASLISGIFSVTFCFTALPLTAFGTDKFGCRPLVMFGGFALFLGYLLSSLATGIGVVMLAQGVIGAMGSASIHSPSIIILGRYFDKRRGFANGIAIAAGSLGGFATPVIFTKLMEEYSIRGALLLQSAILLNIVLAASFFRPTELTAKFAKYDKMKNNREGGNVKPDIIGEEFHNGSLLLKDASNGVELNHQGNGCVSNSLHSIEKMYIKEISTPSSSHLKKTATKEHGDSGCTASQFSSAHSLMSPSIADIHFASTAKQADDEKESSKKSCSSTFFKIMDIRMLKNKLVLLFTFVFCLGSVGTCLGVIFVAPLARDKNLTKDEIAITTALVSGSEFIFRIVLGFVADMNIVERYRIVQVSLFGTGAMLFSIPLLESFWHFTIFSVLYGLFSGPLISMYSPVCIDFVGIERFHRVMGILISFQGIVLGALGPAVGALRDFYGSYVQAYQLMASVTLLGATLFFFVPCLRKQVPLTETVIE